MINPTIRTSFCCGCLLSWREWGESQPLRTAFKLTMDICRAEFRQTPGWGCSCLARLEGFPFLDQAGENWFRIVFLAPLSFENRPWSDFRCHERVRVNRHLHHATTALICFYSFLLLLLTKKITAILINIIIDIHITGITNLNWAGLAALGHKTQISEIFQPKNVIWRFPSIQPPFHFYCCLNLGWWLFRTGY